jgi:Uma2 family endonuclease
MSTLKLKPRKTAEDYMRLPEGTRAELIEGEIFMSPSPKERHQSRIGNVYSLLREKFRQRKLGRVWMAPFDVHLPTGDIVQPDLIAIAMRNLGIVKDWIYGVPELLIEVLSPDGAERDRIVKKLLYARNGVPEYWIVDDEANAVEVFKLAGDRYEPLGYFERGDVIQSAVFPELALPVTQVFED